nr:hypothetical protein [Acutalibacter muris]
MAETTVGKIRVGTKLLLGQYGVSADEIFPIMWLKATPNGDFIAAKVLDYICFDGRERQSADYNMRMFGNPDYGRSNILQFLNSQDESWWNPTHESDSPPDRSNVCNINDAYHDHCGFLYNFEEYEIDSLVRKLIHTPSGVRESLMRLPSYSDLVGDDRFQLFSRRGIRANGSEDYILHRGLYANFDTGSYVEFWLSDLYNNGDYKAVLSRNGEMGYKHPYHSAGLRPVCTLKPDSVLEMDENGFCWVKQVGGQDKLFTNDELFELLGVARP